MLIKVTMLAAVFTTGTSICALGGESPRQVVSLDQGWRFHRGDLPCSEIGTPIAAWRWKSTERPQGDPAAASPALDAAGADWQDARPGQDVFKGRRGFAWFQATIPASKAERPVASFDGVDDNATVFLNGKFLARHEGWDLPFSVPLAAAWKSEGQNVLTVLVENTNNQGGIGSTMIEGAAAGDPGSEGPVAPGYDDRSWAEVDVPHDYIVEGTFDPKADASHGSLPVEPAWYRKSIKIPADSAGKRLWLELDGVYRSSQMWLNGNSLGLHRSGYTPIRHDITSIARPGKDNILTVRVDPTRWEGWWYDGGGIYRHTRLVTVDPVHVEPSGVFVTSEVPDPADGKEAVATVTVATTLRNESANAVEATIESEVHDAEDKSTAQLKSSQRIAAGGTALVTQKMMLPEMKLWSLERPYLYSMRSAIRIGDRLVDQVSTDFGVRTIRFDADKGFFLNGKPVKIKGTCNHQDFAGLGIAMPDEIHGFRIAKLKEMGSNAYRCSHHPHSPAVLDACDRQGMLVMDENRKLGDSEEILSQVESMVLRDRNHPSVILWSLCNEEGEQGSERGAAKGRAMKDVIRRLDPTRPVTAAMNGGYGTGLTGVVDVMGFNYHIGDYDRIHEKFPQLRLIGSETASAVGTRGSYAMEKFSNGSGNFFGDPKLGYVAAYDVNAPNWANTAEAAWRAVADRPFIAGCFVWTGFDYKGEPTPYAWPCVNSHFGIMDMCGFPKDGYWYYKSWWTDEPVLHIFPHWNWPGKEGQEIEVWCYSNCEKVELSLNGASLGEQEMKPNGHLVWRVKYQPGVLEAKGVRKGQPVTDRVETTGPPAAIEYDSDGSIHDSQFLKVRIVDDKGRTVPTADNEITFLLNGSGGAMILGVGNGDPSSHEPDKSMKRRAFNGRCLVAIDEGIGGTSKLHMESPGLKSAGIVWSVDR
jgi:beta-galactosidase